MSERVGVVLYSVYVQKFDSFRLSNVVLEQPTYSLTAFFIKTLEVSKKQYSRNNLTGFILSLILIPIINFCVRIGYRKDVSYSRSKRMMIYLLSRAHLLALRCRSRFYSIPY